MTYSREGVGPRGTGGCLRTAAGLPLGLLHALNTLLVYSAVRYGPQGVWDDRGYTRISAVCFAVVCLSVLALLVTLVPPVRRTLGTWWLAPPLVLGAIAWIRMATLE
ncbi:hypothetical protein ACFV7Q_16100 [Streptomyces sp. NPDC059851]|uniref:hypothetical protein n=1 Tax=Streptomyces sp. NPDC059851 TaxID=3346971 RepID=UPI00365A37D5